MRGSILCTASVLLVLTGAVVGEQKCGLVPTKVFLSKGEKKQLVFWTDQDYSNVPTTTQAEDTVDSFLQAVNGQLPGFGNKEPGLDTNTQENVTTEKITTAEKVEVTTQKPVEEELVTTSNVWTDPEVEVFTTERGEEEVTETAEETKDEEDVITTIKQDEETTAQEQAVVSEVSPTEKPVDTNIPEENATETALIVEPNLADNLDDAFELEGEKQTPENLLPEFSVEEAELDNLLPSVEAIVADEETTTSTDSEINAEITDISDENVDISKATLAPDVSTTATEDLPTETTTHKVNSSETESLEVMGQDNSEEPEPEVVETTILPVTTDQTEEATTTEYENINDDDIDTNDLSENNPSTLNQDSDSTTANPDPTLDYEINDKNNDKAVEPISTLEFEEELSVDIEEPPIQGLNAVYAKAEAVYQDKVKKMNTNIVLEPIEDPEKEEELSVDVVAFEPIASPENDDELSIEAVELTEAPQIYDDDVDNSDKISVVNAMTVEESNAQVEDLDDISVVTSSSVEAVPTFDDLEEFVNIFKDATTLSSTIASEDETTMKVSETTEGVTDASFSTEGLLKEFDFFGEDNGFLHDDFKTPKTKSKTTTASATTAEITTKRNTREENTEGPVEDTNQESTVKTTEIPVTEKNLQTESETVRITAERITEVNTKSIVDQENTSSYYPDIITAAEATTTTSTTPTPTISTTTTSTTSTETTTTQIYTTLIEEYLAERSTYFPLSEIQDDDTDTEYENLSDLQVLALEAQEDSFDDTTTGSPAQIVNELELEAVEVDTETIFDDTTTPGPAEDTFVPVNFGGLEAVEAEETTLREFEETTTGGPPSIAASLVQEVEENPPGLEIEAVLAEQEGTIFDETTTGSPPSVAASLVQEVEENLPGLEIEAVLAEEDGTIFEETTTGGPASVTAEFVEEKDKDHVNTEQENLSDIKVEAVLADEEEGTIFDDTTTGSPITFPAPAQDLVVQAVEAEEEGQEFLDTTTGSYLENHPQDDDVDDVDTTTVGQMTGHMGTEQTPAMTTATTKNTTTAPLNILEKEITLSDNFVSDNVVFPEVEDDMLDMLKDVIFEGTTIDPTTVVTDGEEPIEMTTVRVEVGENIVETTSRRIISATKLKDNQDNIKEIEKNTVPATTPTSTTPLTDSAVVQVQAEGVNGPLNLDEAVYYDDTDDDDYEIDNELTTKEAEDILETTTMQMTTVVNGFVVNKNPVLNTLDNNGIETVRTGGDIKVDISNDVAETTIVPQQDTTTTTNMVDTNFITTIEVETTTKMGETEATSEVTIGGPKEDTTAGQKDVKESTTSVGADTTTDDTTSELVTDTAEETIAVEVDDTVAEQNGTATRPQSKYPITDLLNSIYRLVTGIRESTAAENTAKAAAQTAERASASSPETGNGVEIQYFDSPLAQPLNVHNAPRDAIVYSPTPARLDIQESVDLYNSNTDPFQQLSAPDLTGFIPEGEVEDNVQYIFASQRKQEPARTLSPFNSDALRVEEPPKVLVKKVQEEQEEESSFSLSSLLPSFFSSPAERVQVAGSLPVTVRDPGQKTRRPQDTPSLLSSLFSRPTTRRPALRPRPRPLRPDVPAQAGGFSGAQAGGFIPVVPGRQRGQPVSIPLPMQGQEEPQPSKFAPKVGEFSREDTSRMLRFIDTRPLPLRNALTKPRSKRQAEEEVNCTWTIQTEKNLYLLVTFHNLSAPFTVDCEGAYIEVERENNGFEARWCGNRVTQGGSRPHVIFARNEVRITVFDDGLEGKTLPTGFNADVEVIDLFDGGQLSSLRKTNAYSSVRKLAGRSLVRR